MNAKSAHTSQVWPRRAFTAAAACGLAASSLLVMQPASAAVPSFPDNVVVFPDRDFVSVEGYAEHAGETALVQVTRPGSGVVGSARSVVSGTDVAFEVNHPGGVCWGAGTTDKVTPDIKAGDVVSISFENGTSEETTTAEATVTEDMVRSGSTVTVNGTIDAGANKAFFEQRVINPDLNDTAIGRRDVRALPGPLVPSDKGGYSSGVAFPTATTFVATYVFDDPAVAEVVAAADLGERAMSWQVEDADGNRQGLTIAEFGELGGPGMGGCPAGPGDQPAPVPGAASVVRSADKTSMQVKWTPATPQPGAGQVTGYSVVAISDVVAGGQQVQVGMRTDAAATQSTITGLDPAQNYAVELRSLSGARMSDAFTVAPPAPPTTPGDTTPPTLTVSPEPSASGVTTASVVTATSNGQIYYTVDGSPVIEGDLPSDSARVYTGPIPIAARTTVKIVAFDQVGLHRLVEGEYAPDSTPVPAPDAPANLKATAGQGQVALTWDASTGATAYQVTVYNAAGTTPVPGAQPAETTARAQTVTGLTGGTTYQFSVKAKNASGLGAESAKVTAAVQAITDRVTITTARWRTGEFRVTGTGSVVGSSVTVHRVTANGEIGAAIPNTTAAVVAAAPPAIGEYSIRARDGAAPATNPGRIFVKSTGGGVAGPFTVTR